MGEFIANRPDQIVDTAIRCLSNLASTDVFTESLVVLGESSKKEDSDSSLKEKIIKALDNTAKAIENHGKVSKEAADKKFSGIKSKNLPNEKIRVHDTKRMSTLSKNTKKELEKAVKEGADKSKIDKIMETYREHKKGIIATAVISVIAIPAFVSGAKSQFQETINSNVSDVQQFTDTLKDEVDKGEVDPKTAAAAASGYAEVTREHIKIDASAFSAGINSVKASLGQGES